MSERKRKPAWEVRVDHTGEHLYCLKHQKPVQLCACPMATYWTHDPLTGEKNASHPSNGGASR